MNMETTLETLKEMVEYRNIDIKQIELTIDTLPISSSSMLGYRNEIEAMETELEALESAIKLIEFREYA